jgi:thiamine monophosphate synthase
VTGQLRKKDLWPHALVALVRELRAVARAAGVVPRRPSGLAKYWQGCCPIPVIALDGIDNSNAASWLRVGAYGNTANYAAIGGDNPAMALL